MTENLPDTNVGNIEYIECQAAIDTLAEQIALCDKALKSFGISMKDEYAVKVERASLIAYKEQLEAIPAADVVPVEHSQWIKTADGAECEKCGREAVYQIIDDHWQYEPFCPHCGARMDGKGEE